MFLHHGRGLVHLVTVRTLEQLTPRPLWLGRIDQLEMVARLRRLFNVSSLHSEVVLSGRFGRLDHWSRVRSVIPQTALFMFHVRFVTAEYSVTLFTFGIPNFRQRRNITPILIRLILVDTLRLVLILKYYLLN